MPKTEEGGYECLTMSNDSKCQTVNDGFECI